MAANDTASMALFCDFENIALGVRDAQYEKFDIRPVLERLLAKGSIVVKKAYCDWDRYKGFKSAMHEANFELIEIPHVRQSGKNSADIRMVVDALDLCYTKAHVDTFVIISGDSDFSPLVSKLRENAKRVVGVGVKQSCSDLLVTNCDEFIYYDDLVRDREGNRISQRREREKRTPEEEAKRREKMEERKTKAVDLVSSTLADMLADRGDAERVWASVLKEVVKRRNPGFSESYFGFRTFGNLLEEAASRGLLAIGRDEKSGNFVMRAKGGPESVQDIEAHAQETSASPELPSQEFLAPTQDLPPVVAVTAVTASHEGEAAPVEVPKEAAKEAPKEEKGQAKRRGGRRLRGEGKKQKKAESQEAVSDEAIFAVFGEPAPAESGVIPAAVTENPAVEEDPLLLLERQEALLDETAAKQRRTSRRPQKKAVSPAPDQAVSAVTEVASATAESDQGANAEPVVVAEAGKKPKRTEPKRTPAGTRSRKPRKAKENEAGAAGGLPPSDDA